MPIDNGRDIVGVGVNTVSTQTADVLGECEHRKMDEDEGAYLV